jgi:hypothetical protein
MMCFGFLSDDLYVKEKLQNTLDREGGKGIRK